MLTTADAEDEGPDALRGVELKALLAVVETTA